MVGIQYQSPNGEGKIQFLIENTTVIVFMKKIGLNLVHPLVHKNCNVNGLCQLIYLLQTGHRKMMVPDQIV